MPAQAVQDVEDEVVDLKKQQSKERAITWLFSLLDWNEVPAPETLKL